MSTQYRCRNEQRRAAVRLRRGPDDLPIVNGIDYLEVVSADQRTLEVHLLHPLPGEAGGVPGAPVPPLTRSNVAIEGGVRITGIVVQEAASAGNVLTVRVDAAGDFSTYTLRLVSSPTETDPPEGFDPQLSAVEFSFKVACPGEFDCAVEPVCPEETGPEPRIDYLAKDYASFRQLMLDRLSVVMPGWTERNPADVGIALVELLAYAADHLSYFQDAVATEAYLATARRRVSVRRHARLLDYPVHDGANARAWVVVEVEPGGPADGVVLPGPTTTGPGTRFMARIRPERGAVHPDEVQAAVSAGAEVFESLHSLTLRSSRNQIPFYTWGDELCYLPAGSTRASLRNDADVLADLAPGALLLFEEVRSPSTRRVEDADPTRRHVVRLTRVERVEDPLFDDPAEPGHPLRVAEVEWDVSDALPFDLCLGEVRDPDSGTLDRFPLSVARGNVVLVDHGRTVASESLGVAGEGVYRPPIPRGPLTQQAQVPDRKGRLVAFDPRSPASSVYRWDLRDVRPAIVAWDVEEPEVTWSPVRDLLDADPFTRAFVVETEEDGLAYLRFGDNVSGMRPGAGTELVARYRVGNGSAGNVGPDAIAHVVTELRGIADVRNPLPAQGGVEPESLEQVRLYAPQAFRVQERAVTPADYAAAAQRHPEVQRAEATLRWTGSWYTVFLTVDRRGGRPVDEAFEIEMRDHLERFRMAGYDLEIDGPIYVPLDIAITVCVQPGYFAADVKAALLERFGNAEIPGGGRGFFHPDNFTFGQPVYLSQVVAAAMEVPGVKWVDTDDTPPKPNRFGRWGQASRGETAAGRITFERLEIARLDNSANTPENGRLEFYMKGGL